LRGRFYLSRQTKADNEKAIEFLQPRRQHGPELRCGPGRVGPGCVWRLFLFTPNEKQWEEKAFVAVEKALSIDPDLPQRTWRGDVCSGHRQITSLTTKRFRNIIALSI
jgi:hypothetical protein